MLCNSWVEFRVTKIQVMSDVKDKKKCFYKYIAAKKKIRKLSDNQQEL